jgi:Tol biopolymer transport system component
MRYPLRFAAGAAVALAVSSIGASAQQPDGGKSKKPDLPLSIGRHVNFTTSKASWMSLDVSPDGQTIVFDLLGDLYTLPIAGGTATRLTTGMSMDNQPRFSPDGKKIVFVSDLSGGDNLWTLSLDKKDTVQITKGNDNLYASPEFTPDGKYIVAAKSGGLGGAAKLWIYHVDGGSGAALVREPAALKVTGPTVSHDGRYVWYSRRQGDWQYNAVFPQYQLAVYDRETGTNTTMSSRYGSAFRPQLSHDGKWLVYGSRFETNTGLRIRNVQSGVEDWLVYPIQRDDQESRSPLDVLPGYAFTPDDKAIVMSYGGEIWRVPVDKTKPVKIPFTANVSLDVGPEVRFAYKVDDAASFTAHQIRDVAPSPDGKRLAFVSLNRVYLLDLPNGTPRRLTNQDVGEYYPTWSPDGKSIAFATWNDKAGGQIFKATVDGKSAAPQQLTKTSALYTQLAWAPDGRRIVAVKAAARDMQEALGFFGGGLGTQFVWVPATGGDMVVIGPSGNRVRPHFTQDTTRIFAYSFNEGLVSMRWDGTDVKAILKVTGPIPPMGTLDDDHTTSADMPMPTHYELEQNPTPPPAQLVMMAPRGDRALAEVGNDVYVVTVPYLGGPTPTVSVANPASAAFPARRLTDIGGEFSTWSADGKMVHWAIGNAFVSFDLDRAKQVDDSIAAAKRARGDSTPAAPAAKPDSTKPDSTKKAPAPTGYKPVERRITIPVSRDLPQGDAVLRGARVVTMKGKEVLEDADIVIHNNRITAVGKRGSVSVPNGAQVIDVAGKTILPGFVDTHYHPQWLIPDVHTAQVWQYLAQLAYGVTTTRDPQTATTDVLTYEDEVEAGHMVGPRIYSTGPGVFSGENLKDLDQTRNVLKRYATYYDTKTLKMYMTGNRQQRQWVIMAAKELGLMPTTEGGLDFKLNMTHAIDGYAGIEHALPIAPLYEDVVELFKQTGVTNSPTLIVSYGGPFGENYWYTHENVHGDAKLRRFTPEAELDAKTRRRGTGSGGSPGPGGWFMDEEYAFPLHAQFAKKVVEAGGRIGIGSHGQLQGLGYQWEMWMMASGGMSNHDVLRTATILGAEGIGMSGDLGSIEGGKLADLVVLDKNPLENIRNTNTIRYVMKNGRLYDGNTLDEVYPSKRAMQHFVWQDGAPEAVTGTP